MSSRAAYDLLIRRGILHASELGRLFTIALITSQMLLTFGAVFNLISLNGFTLGIFGVMFACILFIFPVAIGIFIGMLIISLIMMINILNGICIIFIGCLLAFILGAMTDGLLQFLMPFPFYHIIVGGIAGFTVWASGSDRFVQTEQR